MTFKEFLTGNFYIYAVDKGKVVRFPLLVSPNGEAKVVNTPNGVDYLGNVVFNENVASLTLIPLSNQQSKTIIFLKVVEFQKEVEFLLGVYTTIGKLFVESSASNYPSAGRILIQKTNDANFVIGIDKYETPKNLLRLLTTDTKKFDVDSKDEKIKELEKNIDDINKTWSEKFQKLEDSLLEVKYELEKLRTPNILQGLESESKLKIKLLIGSGDLKKSIEELLISCLGKPAYNEIILLNSRLSTLEMELRINVIDEDKSRIERNKIIRALLEIIDNNL
jgi:hypothetical protein